MKNKLILLIFILSSKPIFAQIQYQTEFNRAISVEGVGLSPIVSINFEKNFNSKSKSFNTFRAGLGFVPGGGNQAGAFTNFGLSVPLALTHNFILRGFSKKGAVLHLSQRRIAAPERYKFETFGEYGIGTTPAYYVKSSTTPQSFKDFNWLILGLRLQLLIDSPGRDSRVYFLKAQYCPNYVAGQVSFVPVGKHPVNVFGVTLGRSMR